MKNLLLLLLISTFSCASTAQKSQKPPQEIKAVYYQHWSAGQELGGSGTDFYIEFKKPLAVNIALDNLYFNNRLTKVEKVSETLFVGHYYQRPELVIDENGNRNIVHKTPEINSKYNLKDKEAVLEFTKSKKKLIFKFKNVTVKEYLAYP